MGYHGGYSMEKYHGNMIYVMFIMENRVFIMGILCLEWGI
jgi:hypothetical protein